MSHPAGAARLLVQRAGRPMATDVSVQIAAPAEQEEAASRAADACMAWFDEVDARLSRFQPESELSRLNRAGGCWFAASSVLFEAVAVAVWGARASGGRFDPTLLRHLEALGYDRDFAQIAQRDVPSSAAPLLEAPAPGAWRAIELDARRQRIRLPASVGLDLGGIAKGWAADVALSRFCGPFPGALVNVGGDLRAQGGPAAGQAWSVGLRDPREELAGASALVPPASPSYLAVITFSRGGLATSGALRRWWTHDGQRQHHLLDPLTGRPVPLWTAGSPAAGESAPTAPLIATATALAPTAARAEVAAKVALLRSYPEALRAVEAAWERYGAVGPETDADAGVALVLTFGNGETACSANLDAYLASWGTDGAALPTVIWPAPGASEKDA